MSMSLKSVAVTAASWLVFAGLLQSAEEVAKPKPSSESAAALVSPEFAEHFDVDAAAAAFRADNAEALIALGEKLAAAERAKGKSNPPLPAKDLYRLAIQIAQRNHDLPLLDRMDKQLRSDKQLSKSDSQSLMTEIGVARKIAAGSRKIDAGPGLKANQVSAEAIALYNTFVKEIRITQDYGTEEELTQLVDGIRQLRELHPKQREHLAQMATTARVAIRERDTVEGPLTQLVAVSRSVVSGLRIIGPGEVSPNGTVSLVVIPTGPASTKPGQLHFRASPGVQVPEHLEWSGKPVVVSAIIKAAAGTRVFVSAGLDAKANSLSWNAQTTRE